MSNANPNSPIGHLLILPQTDRWSSAIMAHATIGQARVCLFKNAADLAAQLALFPNGIAVIEICENLLADAKGFQAVFNPQFNSIPKIAVGGVETRHLHLDLIRAGFAEALHSTAEVARLLRIAANYFKNQPDNQLSIEQKVDRDLPWTPILG